MSKPSMNMLGLSTSPKAILPWLVFVLLLAARTAPSTSQSLALLHSLFDPSTNAQPGTQQGFSVAVDGNIVVVGARSDDAGIFESGVVKVYDLATGGLLHTLVNPSPAGGDRFGISVGVFKSRVVVGAPGDDTGTNDAGCAYVYDLAGFKPTLPFLTLTNPGPAIGDNFGNAVAIFDSRVLVGASSDNSGVSDAGSAYAFDLAGATPTVPSVTLTNPSPAVEDQFGSCVALSDSWALIGVPLDDTPGATSAGSVYVYDFAGAMPSVPVFILTNPSPATADSFGYSAAISGTRVVVGGLWADQAYVYDLVGSFRTSPTITLNNPRPGSGNHYGNSVAISGTRIVVGAVHDHNGVSDAGSAYVYDLAGAAPRTPVAKLRKLTPVTQDFFGYSVAVSGTRVVVGAILDDALATDAGAAYVYQLTNAPADVPIAALNSPSPSSHDYFGHAVAISGTHVVIGAPADNTGVLSAGVAYVCDLASSTPRTPFLTLTNPSPALNDSFGSSVAISGPLIVVGAFWDNTGATHAGIAYVYKPTSPAPHLPVLTLTNPSPAIDDSFGSRVAVSGTWVVVGMPRDDFPFTNSGSAYIYNLASATPTQPVLTLTNPSPAEHDQFGGAVAITDRHVVIGAPLDDSPTRDAGSAFVYDLSSPTPSVPVATLKHPNPRGSESFGESVAISGMRVAVGAPDDDTAAPNAGSTFVYDLASLAPRVPVVALTNPSPSLHDRFGATVALSGARLVVGTPYDDTRATNAGSIYVYDLAGPAPGVPVVTLTNPSPAENDNFGIAIGIDGTTVIAGVYYEDTIAQDRGAAYVFGLLPNLTIAPAGPGFATVSWTPTSAPGFVLQSTDSLTFTNWVNASTGSANPVTVPTTNSARFYRLALP